MMFKFRIELHMYKLTGKMKMVYEKHPYLLKKKFLDQCLPGRLDPGIGQQVSFKGI